MSRRRLPQYIKQIARKLRREQTKSEAKLWEELRSQKLVGFKFLRQHPILFQHHNKQKFIITDFYCHKAGLIIELDGVIHERQKDYDKARDQLVEMMGLKVFRIKNEEIEKDLLKVMNSIKRQVKLS
jgi:very-short-patch-repair endonuclease